MNLFTYLFILWGRGREFFSGGGVLWGVGGNGMYVCVWGGRMVADAMPVELLPSKITTVCETKRRLYNILIITKVFDQHQQLLPNFDQPLSRTGTSKTRSNVLIN